MKLRNALIVILLLAVVPMLLNAQNATDDEKVIKKNVNIKINGVPKASDFKELEQFGKLNNVDINLGMNDEEGSSSAFIGIYPADIDFPKAQELSYPNNYGVLITGVVKDSPAYQYRLAEDDIIMEINAKKVMNQKEFDKMKSYYRAGDAVTLTLFRSGEVIKQDFVFGTRQKEETVTGTEEKPEKKHLSRGYGGGGYIPMWFDVEMDDVNNLLGAIGFNDLIPTDGILTQGIAGKGPLGKGWFIGGNIQWYGITRKSADYDSVGIGTGYNNNMRYSLTLGGVTLDKRFALAKGVTTSFGVMLGGASHQVEVVHTNNNYNWPANQNATIGDIMDGNTFNTFSKGYLLVQPKAEFMVHFLPWLGLRAEGGYLYGYSTSKGWKVRQLEDETPNTINNSPDTPMQGWSVTVGPWFGF